LEIGNQIIEEEFLDTKVLKLSVDNFLKRVKLGMYILKENQKTDISDEKTGDQIEDLNCTMVWTLNPHSEYV